MNTDNEEFLASLIANPPMLEYWDNASQSCGFDSESLLYLETTLKDLGYSFSVPKVIQTGAGVSTLWFLGKGAEVHTFCEIGLRNRIASFLSSFNFEYEWYPHFGDINFALPQFSQSRCDEFGLALIDGNHSVINVFNEFYYINHMLSYGSLIFIDDIQLVGPSLLCKYLDSYCEDFKFYNEYGKTRLYIKITAFNNFKPERDLRFLV